MKRAGLDSVDRWNGLDWMCLFVRGAIGGIGDVGHVFLCMAGGITMCRYRRWG